MRTAPSTSDTDKGHDEARLLFPAESLQYLDPERAAQCQKLLGHGDRFGFWETPPSLVGRRNWNSSQRCVDLRKRLTDFLPKDIRPSTALNALLDEGVLWITRYALLLRLEPTANRRPLDATTIGNIAYTTAPRMLAQSIQCKLNEQDNNNEGLTSLLTPECIRHLSTDLRITPEVNRMRRLVDRGLWNDAPPKPNIAQTTSPKGQAIPRQPQYTPTPFPPIPDDYLAEMGPRVLWLIQDLGPNLIHLFEAIPELFSGIQFGPDKNPYMVMRSRLGRYFSETTWTDDTGQPIIAPPFKFKIGLGRLGTDPYAWPPSIWEHVKVLATSLQAAHLWVALLAMAGRISEIDSLTRGCTEWARDGKPYANGKTYKLSANLAGTDHEWPAPEVLVQALAQQSRLVSAWEQIARITKGESDEDILTAEGDHLWASMGLAGSTDPEVALNTFGSALQMLAMRIGLSPKPGGKNLHPHRFRKTIARLAGLAIVNSPSVLMKLFGHKDIAMTLHYILTDKALQVEINQVARELRIMRCQDLIEDIHMSLHAPDEQKHGGYGGGGAPILTEMVKKREEELHQKGKQWDADSAYELSVILTGNGQYFRQTLPGVLCLKESKEAGLCTCDSTCVNRIEEKTARRDVRKIIPILLEDGIRALAENHLLLVADKLQQLEEELLRFEDIQAEFNDHPDLSALRGAVA